METPRPVLRAPLCMGATRGGESSQRSLPRHPDQMRGAVGFIPLVTGKLQSVQSSRRWTFERRTRLCRIDMLHAAAVLTGSVLNVSCAALR